MPHPVIEHLSRGSFIFVRSDPNEIRRIVPSADEMLPNPQKIFLADEAATPVVGYPIASSRGAKRLAAAMGEYLAAEQTVQVAAVTRGSFDSRAYAAAWEGYRGLLAQTLENTIRSSLSYDYTSLFWLDHSLPVAQQLVVIPKRLRQQDPSLGRDHGDDIKYKVLSKWMDRVSTLTYDLAHQMAGEMDEDEENLFPRLLGLMRDNVLLLTEDYISPDLSELDSYFRGYLMEDGRDLRQRVKSVEKWHDRYLASEPLLRAAASELLGVDPDGDSRKALFHPGYVPFLRRHSSYETRQLLDDVHLPIWEGLLQKLKEFEVVHALRKMVVPIETEGQKMFCRDRSSNTTWVGGPPVLELSSATRPIDFHAPWVVNPVVQRFGLVYDITDFSATISTLGRAQKSALDNAFRMSAQFQRKIDRLAFSLAIRLEKYLGDGAFYSGREARRMLAMAIHLQRLYPRYVSQGFPFDKGLRIALNFGEYRLLPLEAEPGSIEPRYEYFGHGLVELSRLSTGKKTQELETFRTFLVSQGYPEGAVNKFFAPMMQRNAELVSKVDEARDFYAYIDQTQTLINEGIVATGPFIDSLGTFENMLYTRAHSRGFIVVQVPGAYDEPVAIGFRKLGAGQFKGLEPIPVFEVIDAGGWNLENAKPVPTQPLSHGLERLFTQTMTAAQRARDSSRG